MPKAFPMVMFLTLALPAFAAGDDGVAYAGGTVSQIKAGAAGSLDLSSGAALRFSSSSGDLDIPYSAIDSWQHTNEPAVHLGVLPAIAVGAVAARKRNQYLRITYTDSDHVTQVAVFQVPKRMLRYIVPALESRAPNAHWLVDRTNR